MGTDQSSGAKNDTTISPHQERSLSDSARGQKSIPNNAAIGPINLSRVTFKDIGSTSTNSAEEADATSFTHRELGYVHSSSDDESESDDDSDDEGKSTSWWEFLVIL
jgi:hypothetical protein